MTLGSRDAVFPEPQGFVTTQASRIEVLSSSNHDRDGLDQARGSVIHEVQSAQIEKCTMLPLTHFGQSQALRGSIHQLGVTG